MGQRHVEISYDSPRAHGVSSFAPRAYAGFCGARERVEGLKPIKASVVQFLNKLKSPVYLPRFLHKSANSRGMNFGEMACMSFYERKAREDSPSKPERIFLGLVREPAIAEYVGRASQLSDEELRALYAVAQAALREADRRDLLHESRKSLRTESMATEAFRPESKPSAPPVSKESNPPS
jgi:hypothetical protein